MRTDVAPWNDARVRQAMRLIADRGQLVSQGLAGHGRVANDIFSPNDPSYDSGLAQRTQNIEQAKSLLKAAGRSDLRTTMITSQIYTGLTSLAQVFAQQAKQAGVTIALQQLDPTSFFGKNWLSYGLTQDFWTNRDYLSTAGLALAPKGPYNETHWGDSRWDSVYSQALGTVDMSKRTDLIHELQQIEYDRGGYIIWGFADFVDGLSAKLHGLTPDPALPLGHYDFGGAYLA
jgi:peptide/nickel transport system substrate-binding protein